MIGAALSESRNLRFAAFSALYAAQGIPDAMVLIVFPALLAARGASPGAIGGFLAIAMLPNSLKLLSGPLIDRVAYHPMGRRRPWVMFGQFGIAASFLYLSLIGDPASHLALLTLGAFFITLATVFQDVATDGMAMDLVPEGEQGRANGIMWGSKTLGTAAAASIGAMLLHRHGFAALVLAAAAMLALVFLLAGLVRERPGERLMPWTTGQAAVGGAAPQPGSWRDLALLLWAAVRQPEAIRLIIISICIGLFVGLLGALLPVLLVQHFEWAEADYAQLRSMLKLAAGIVGMSAGGILIDRLGTRRIIRHLFGALFLVCLALAVTLTARLGIIFLVATELALVFIFISFFAATMKQCSRAIAATQFSFTMVCGNIALVGGAALLGPLDSAFGLRGPLCFLALISGCAAIIAARLATGTPALADDSSTSQSHGID